MKHLSETELVSRINLKDPEAFDQLFELYRTALIFLTDELIGKKDSETLVSNMFKEISKCDKQFNSYYELQNHIYTQAIEVIISYAKNQPFSMPLVIKIEQEAREQVFIAEYLRKTIIADRLAK